MSPPRPAASMYWAFFFQAEDGIRGGHVTGVQTCALPIYRSEHRPDHQRSEDDSPDPAGSFHHRARSEERRVGKECRFRWWTDQLKKNRRSVFIYSAKVARRIRITRCHWLGAQTQLLLHIL